MFKTHNHPLNLLRHIGKLAKKHLILVLYATTGPPSPKFNPKKYPELFCNPLFQILCAIFSYVGRKDVRLTKPSSQVVLWMLVACFYSFLQTDCPIWLRRCKAS